MSDTNAVVIVGVKSHIWDARTSLQPEDLELSKEQLPEKAVAGLGSKYTFDRSHLRPLLSARGLLYRTLKEYGVSVGNAYVIPQARYPEVLKEVNEIIANFNKDKEKLKRSAPRIYEEWRENVPERFRPQAGPDKVLEEISGSYLDTIEFEVGSLSKKASNQLSDRLLDEVVQSAEEMFRGSFLRYGNRKEASQRILQPLKRLKTKIESMLFIDAKTWRPVLENITNILDQCPKKGKLQSSHLSSVYVLLVALRGMRDQGIAQSLNGNGNVQGEFPVIPEATSEDQDQGETPDDSDSEEDEETEEPEAAAVGQWF